MMHFPNVSRLLLAWGLLCLPVGAGAGVHSPDVEARLERLVGDWTVKGQEATYREKCEWFGDRAFVTCFYEDRSDNSRGHSILGYSKADGHFTYHNYRDSGSSNSRIGFPHGEKGIVFVRERRSGGKHYRTSTYLEPRPDGSIYFREDQSTDGAPFEKTFEFDYVRRK
jgi:hypothetical protein